MLMAMTMMSLGQSDRELYLYDAYDAISEPTKRCPNLDGRCAGAISLEAERDSSNESSAASLEEVRANLISTGYPKERMHFVCGRVEETIPRTIPEAIAILRLDTDWYESTAHEFAHLYPRVSVGGAVIIHDYQLWKGARNAVEEQLGVLVAMRIRPSFDSKSLAILKKARSELKCARPKTCD